MLDEKIDSKDALIKALADEIEACMEESYPVVDFTAQAVTQVIESAYAEPDVNRQLNKHRIIALDPLSSHESYRIMEKFARSRPGEQAQRLLDAISQKHPFRMFDGAIKRMGIAEDWYAWRREAIQNHAADLLEAYGVDFIDGVIVCNDEENVSTFKYED
ncbi:MAG: hypothetical protein II840_03135 [Kiritimatiellae bacterium]|nr:hypothetical protein [Kiritimatiellia bacterium]